tara:strand:- start:715 stop:1293 length:579 start_codon:yes stop_codon:yes gene_type:complete
MKVTKLVFAIAFISSQVAAEECKVKHLEKLEYTDIECQFYMGTAAYRNEVYSVAAAHWEYLLSLEAKYKGDNQTQAIAKSTLNYLRYHGLGIIQDRNTAVRHWLNSAKSGVLEARRHLGFAYSDENFEHKNLVTALGWYRSILTIYPNADELDENDKNIHLDVTREIRELEGKLSKEQINASEKFAKSVLFK